MAGGAAVLGAAPATAASAPPPTVPRIQLGHPAQERCAAWTGPPFQIITTLPADCYQVEVGRSVRVSALSVLPGRRWRSGGSRLVRSTRGAEDWPDYAERSLMIDVGRRFLSVP